MSKDKNMIEKNNLNLFKKMYFYKIRIYVIS